MVTNVDIVGATGYTGQELIDILLDHPNVKINGLYSTMEEPVAISELLPRFKNRTNLICKKFNKKELVANKSQVVFLALPHTYSMDVVAELIKANKYVIDLSADYRLKNTSVYERFYNIKHKDKTNLNKAVYGLPEIYRQKIKNAKLVANPGCYPTAAILALAPLVATDSIELDSIIIDAKSGTSGAGKKAAQDLQFSEIDEDFKPYKVNIHQHMPEIEQELSKLSGKNLKVVFVPHILPLKRGILETIYVRTAAESKPTTAGIISLYKRFYKTEPFLRIRKEGDFPRLRDVVGTNYCDIAIGVFGKNIIVVSAIDNLLKGASGQAVQNMNIMLDYPEQMGLL
jgi:N-acetyl-gamma-glutamyl-phosphate reductase